MFRPRVYCAVYGCFNSSYAKQHLSFFKLPADVERRSKWLRLICREDLANKPPKSYTVCEEHFDVLDVLPGSKRKKLKRNSLPSLRLPEIKKKHAETLTETTTMVHKYDGLKDAAESSTASASMTRAFRTTDSVKKSIDDVARHQTHSFWTDNKCYECSGDIVGCRYVCVQCAQCAVCAACEARGAHHHHYALRVPQHKDIHEAMAILERIRLMINTDLPEVPTDEIKSIKSEVDCASDPLAAMVKVEMLDIDEYEPVPQNVDEANIMQEAQDGDGNKRQQRRKRRAPSPDTRSVAPVTLADTHTNIAQNQLSLLTETLATTKTKTKTFSNQVSIPSSSKTIIKQTLPTYEVPMMTPANVNAPVIFNQATGCVIPIIMYNIPKTEISDELQPDQVHTSAISSSQAQVVSFDPSQPAVEEIVIKTELPD